MSREIISKTILGLSSDATQEEIKKAYKRLALKYHPDKNQALSAVELASYEKQFSEIKEAYIFLARDPDGNSVSDQEREIDIPAQENLFLTAPPVRDIKAFFEKNNLNSPALIFDGAINFIDTSDPKNNKEKILQTLEERKSRYALLPSSNDERALLWVAKKEGCKPIYIFGTCHSVNFDVEDRFGSAFSHIIEQVDVVFTERDISVSSLETTQLIKRIRKQFSEEEIERVLGEKNSFSFPAEDLLSTQCMDRKIAEKAYEMGRPLKSLENLCVLEACGFVFEETGLKINGEPLEALINAYLRYLNISNQDYLTLPQMVTEAVIKGRALCTNRNMYWMEEILSHSMVKQQTILVACGLFHNEGITGLPNLLKAEGYTVTPLMKKAPIATSVLAREAAFGNPFSFFASEQSIDDKQISHSRNRSLRNSRQ